MVKHVVKHVALVKRYLPYALVYVVGVVTALGATQLTQGSDDPVQTASADKASKSSGIRSAKSRRPVASAPRVTKPARAANKSTATTKTTSAKKASTVKGRRVAKAKPAPKPAASASKLRSAVNKGDQRTVKRLLATKKYNVNSVDKRGRSLLLTAVEKGHADVARHLIKAGADVDAKTRAGDTPLMVAARGGDPVIVHMLLEGGAALGVRNRKGRTAKAIAKKGGHDVVYEFIADEVDRRGKHKSMVAKAQKLLNKLGYKLGASDGVAGPRTVRAVRRFQKNHKLRIDGKITPALISALNRKLARAGSGRSLASRSSGSATSTARLVAEPKSPAKSEKASGDSNSWFSKASSSVANFLKASNETVAQHERLCASARDRWVQDSSGNWIECTNVPQY